MATQALVNPEIISWARNRSGYTEDTLAKKVGVKVDRILAWENGELKPTFRQAQNLAKTTHTPFGFFFLKKPPTEKLPIPDLRTIDGARLEQPSTELRDIVEQVLTKQSWYKDYLISQGATPLGFIGAFNLDSHVGEVVESIRDVLDLQTPERGTWSQYYTQIINSAEQAGILVMRSGIVGNNTHRKLQVTEFRGFAISDSLAPVIFINSSDAETARLFTLIHELCHLWIGESGISTVIHEQDYKEEVFCNAVAGEFLVPSRAFNAVWNPELSLEFNINEIAPKFHVSKFVIARRALDKDYISREDYANFYNSELEAFKKRSGSGGDFYVTAGARNSTKFSTAVVSEALSGRILLRDAGKLLGVPPAAIKTYARKVGL